MTLDQFDALNEKMRAIYKSESYVTHSASGLSSNYNIGFLRGMVFTLTTLGYEVDTDMVNQMPQVSPTGVEKGNVG